MEVFLREKEKIIDFLVVGFLVFWLIYNGVFFSYYQHVGERELQLEARINIYELAFIMLFYKCYRSKYKEI